MSLATLESAIDQHVLNSAQNPALQAMVEAGGIRVIKYMPARHLDNTLNRSMLFITEASNFTWGSALYLAPIQYPKTTMMYGEVGVVGTFDVAGARFYDAADPLGVDLYLAWISYQRREFLELTTTVHAVAANRELRNRFRTRFLIDCVYFRPHEPCADYVNPSGDWWLAITHWDPGGFVGQGYSPRIRNLKWCVVAPDSFEPAGKGFRAFLHTGLSRSNTFVRGAYSNLEQDIRAAYQSGSVVICDFQ